MAAWIYVLVSTAIVLMLLSFTIFLLGIRIYNDLVFKKNSAIIYLFKAMPFGLAFA